MCCCKTLTSFSFQHRYRWVSWATACPHLFGWLWIWICGAVSFRVALLGEASPWSLWFPKGCGVCRHLPRKWSSALQGQDILQRFEYYVWGRHLAVNRTHLFLYRHDSFSSKEMFCRIPLSHTHSLVVDRHASSGNTDQSAKATQRAYWRLAAQKAGAWQSGPLVTGFLRWLPETETMRPLINSNSLLKCAAMI